MGLVLAAAALQEWSCASTLPALFAVEPKAKLRQCGSQTAGEFYYASVADSSIA